jgi:hypothetical protein
MNVDKNTLNKIGSMPSDQLKEAIAVIADSLGATPMQKKMAVANASLLRKKLMNMSESEIRSYLNKVPPEKLGELEKKIGL